MPSPYNPPLIPDPPSGFRLARPGTFPYGPHQYSIRATDFMLYPGKLTIPTFWSPAATNVGFTYPDGSTVTRSGNAAPTQLQNALLFYAYDLMQRTLQRGWDNKPGALTSIGDSGEWLVPPSL